MQSLHQTLTNNYLNALVKRKNLLTNKLGELKFFKHEISSDKYEAKGDQVIPAELFR
jgi:hypothetical protein